MKVLTILSFLFTAPALVAQWSVVGGVNGLLSILHYSFNGRDWELAWQKYITLEKIYYINSYPHFPLTD